MENSSMKICFVHEEYPLETNFGGIATYQKIMATYYASKNDLVTVIARGNKDICYYYDNIRVYRIKSLNKIDIIETPDWGATTVYFEKYHLLLDCILHLKFGFCIIIMILV